MVEIGIEPGTSWLVVRNSDHQATRLVVIEKCKSVGLLLDYLCEWRVCVRGTLRPGGTPDRKEHVFGAFSRKR